jgi:hypothetical protein
MKNTSTKIFLLGLAISLNCAFANAQTGLQSVIVEKYYISDANDAAESVGILPVGSVTYRIFVDMKQGYKFQTAYGVPGHTLFINSTTSFFNNEDRGSTSPTYTKSQAKFNTIMLDSWLSAGAACTGNLGVLKADDNGVETVVNADGILQNADPLAGIPLTVEDGLIAGSPCSITALFMNDETKVFDDISQAGNNFIVFDGVWSCLYGAVGPDTTNKVLIAQITTDGVLSFELNIQVGTPEGGTEQFVARDPSGLETQLASLTYNSLFAGIENPKAKIDKTDMLSVFPNPTNGKFTLKVKSETTNSIQHYVIYNCIGDVILNKDIKNTSGNFTDNIDLSSYPNGLYFVEVSVDGYKLTSKLVKN